MILAIETVQRTRGTQSHQQRRRQGSIPPLHLMVKVAILLFGFTAPEISAQTAMHSLPKITGPQRNGNGVRRLTEFERKLDYFRMNALFLDKNATDQDKVDGKNSSKLLAPSCEELCNQCIEIDVYFHLSGFPLDSKDENSTWVIPHPTEEFILLRKELANSTTRDEPLPMIASGRFSNITEIYRLIQDNMNVLNRRYLKTPFIFRWVNSDPAVAKVAVKNNNVFLYAGDLYKSNDFATAAHAGDSKTLNVYLMYRICSHAFIWLESNCRTIGAATNPSYQLDNTADGVFLSYDTLTGGGYEDYDTGISFVHETGHWLGLLHVFESKISPEEADPCVPINDEQGDYVDDTPFIPHPSVLMYDCPMNFYEGEEDSIPNSCPNLQGVDPVFNYMNYVGSEKCLPEGVGEFTCGQIERMYKQWMIHRMNSEACAQNEMKLDYYIHFGSDPSTLHMEINAVDEQDPLFRWDRDMHIGLLDQGFNKTRAFNLCVPSGEYVLAVTDTERNGYNDGVVTVYVDGNLVQNISGDFSSTECIKFGRNGKVADLASPEADFGDRYQYHPPENSSTVTCATSNHIFFEEPIWILKDRLMQVNVSLDQNYTGVCINEVEELDISIDGTTYSIYPDPTDSAPVRYEGNVKSCRNSFCIVEFDLARLVGAYNSKNKDGIYQSTCNAKVKIGFGEACDSFLASKQIECTAQGSEFSANAKGGIQFSIPTSAARSSIFELSMIGFLVSTMIIKAF